MPVYKNTTTAQEFEGQKVWQHREETNRGLLLNSVTAFRYIQCTVFCVLGNGLLSEICNAAL